MTDNDTQAKAASHEEETFPYAGPVLTDPLEWPLSSSFCSRCTMSLHEQYIWADWLYLGALFYCERCCHLEFERATPSEQNALANGLVPYVTPDGGRTLDEIYAGPGT